MLEEVVAALPERVEEEDLALRGVDRPALEREHQPERARLQAGRCPLDQTAGRLVPFAAPHLLALPGAGDVPLAGALQQTGGEKEILGGVRGGR